MTVRRLAVLALLAASVPALAQQATTAEQPRPADQPKDAATAPPRVPFTIYGTLNVNLQLTQAKDATASTADVDPRAAVSIDSSNLGVRGSVDLRDWLQIVFQCETSANVDGISASGICNRNSRLGLASPRYGTLFYGNWDTPYKAQAYATKADDPFLNTDVYGFNGLLGSPGFNYRSSGWSTSSTTAIAGFDVRSSNSVGYQSPRWSGVSFKLQWSANEFKSAGGTQNPTLYSGVVNYDAGPLSVSAAVERHRDGFGLAAINPGTGTPPAGSGVFGSTAPNGTGSATVSAHSTDTAWRVAAGYGLVWSGGETTVSAMFERLRYEQDDLAAGAISEYRRFAWLVGAKHRWHDHELRVRFSMADEGDCDLAGGGDCDTSDYGARELAVGYAYHVTKTAQAYAFLVQIMNEDRAQYTFPIGGAPAVAGSTPPGADPQALGLGLRYSF